MLPRVVDAPNKNISGLFRAHNKSGLADWLLAYMETVQRGYYVKLRVQTQVEKRRRNVVPHEIEAEIANLKKAEATLEKGNLPYGRPERLSQIEEGIPFDNGDDLSDYREHVRQQRKALARRKIAILTLRRERKHLEFRLCKAPPGHQMNYMLDYEAWCLAEKIKEKNNGKPDWELVARLLSEYLPIETMGANQALKAHRRFAELRKDREKFTRVIVSNGLNNNWFGRDYETLKKRVPFHVPKVA